MERARAEGGNGGVKLPIGFRFHPTDEELLIHYLKRKVLSLPLPATVIPEFEALLFNPWDLPGDSKEKRYFFCKRRWDSLNKCSTDCGYWKSAGKDKKIMSAGNNFMVGIKKSFDFYQGRKLKTQWVLQEFSLVGSVMTPFTSQRMLVQVGDWVVCRLYQKKMRGITYGEEGVSFAETTPSLSSCSSGITEISASDLDDEASS